MRPFTYLPDFSRLGRQPGPPRAATAGCSRGERAAPFHHSLRVHAGWLGGTRDRRRSRGRCEAEYPRLERLDALLAQRGEPLSRTARVNRNWPSHLVH